MTEVGKLSASPSTEGSGLQRDTYIPQNITHVKQNEQIFTIQSYVRAHEKACAIWYTYVWCRAPLLAGRSVGHIASSRHTPHLGTSRGLHAIGNNMLKPWIECVPVSSGNALTTGKKSTQTATTLAGSHSIAHRGVPVPKLWTYGSVCCACAQRPGLPRACHSG